VTPENATKWGSVEGTRDNMNWGGADQAYSFAKANGYPFRFHVLIWGSQYPTWITSLTEEEQLDEIEEWFAEVANHFPDIDYLEVVNEALHQEPPFKNALGGNGTTGWDWVIKSFELARQYFPNTPLVLNEYSVVNDPSQMTNYINIVNLLKARGLIDIVAEQAHGFTTGASNSTMTTQLNRLAETGIPIMITEFDLSAADDQAQLTLYQRVFPVFWEHPAVMGITLWGYRPGLWRVNGELVRADDSERPAMQWLREYVASTAQPWLGFPVRYNWADASAWLGDWAYVGSAPWIWSETVGWAWVDEAGFGDNGTWLYISAP
jgi:endo-1,4-beta-xylanase